MHQPPQYAANGNPAGQGQWTTGLFDCAEDPSNCCITCCCPCITLGQSAEILDRGTTSCAMAAIIYVLISSVGCGCLYSYTFRSKLRGMYSLPDQPCPDCCVHYWCTGCAICQEFRELKNRGVDPAVGWVANAQKMNMGGSTAPPNAAQGMYR